MNPQFRLIPGSLITDWSRILHTDILSADAAPESSSRSGRRLVARAISSSRRRIGSPLAAALARRVGTQESAPRDSSETAPQGFAVTVNASSCLAIDDAIGCSVQVLAGRAWITAESELHDIFVDADAAVALKPGVRFIVSALCDVATMLIVPQGPADDIDFRLHTRDGMRTLAVSRGARPFRDSRASIHDAIAAFVRRVRVATPVTTS